MTTNSTAPSRKRGGAVARSEVNGKARTIKLKVAPLGGLVIGDCSKELPSTFTWDGARIQARIAEDDPRVIGDLYRLIESVVSEGGTEAIRKRLIEKKVDPGVDLLVSLLNDITSHYGMELGEPSASPSP